MVAKGIALNLAGRTRTILFALFVAVALYLLAVTPVRTYFHQRSEMAQVQKRYDVLSNANKAMNTRITQLQSDAEIERLAREQYELVPPGQTAFAVMPPSASSQKAAAEAGPATKHKQSLWSHAWDDVTFWN